jgi:hypothetical protein
MDRRGTGVLRSALTMTGSRLSSMRTTSGSYDANRCGA